MEEIRNILIKYDELENCFIININDMDYVFHPSELVEFVNCSIHAINDVIMTKFDKSMRKFLYSDRKTPITFSSDDGKKLADEIDKWLRSRGDFSDSIFA